MKKKIKIVLGFGKEVDSSVFIPPIFLTGCMRSGTTYFAKLLSEHPKIQHIKGELLEPWTSLGGIDCLNKRYYANRESIKEVNKANMIAFFERYRINSQSYGFFERLSDRLKTGSGAIFNNKSSILLNKNVHLINRVDFVLNLIAGSKLIFIVRPIEAQVASLKLHFEKNAKKGWYYKTPLNNKDSWYSSKDTSFENGWEIKDLYDKWFELNLTAIQDLRKNERSNYIIVNYDSLVKNPQNVLNHVFTFLGIDVVKSHFQKGEKLKRKVFNTNTGGNPLNAWKNVLTESEKNMAEEIKLKRVDDLRVIEDSFDV